MTSASTDTRTTTEHDAGLWARAHLDDDQRDRAPSAAELADDARLDADAARAQARLDDAARARGEHVPDPYERSEAQMIALALAPVSALLRAPVDVVCTAPWTYRLDGVPDRMGEAVDRILPGREVRAHAGRLWARTDEERRRALDTPPF